MEGYADQAAYVSDIQEEQAEQEHEGDDDE